MTRLIFIVLAATIVVGVVLASSGVLQFHDTKEKSTITIDKKELKEDVKTAVEKTGEAGGKTLQETSEALHKAAEGLRSPDDKQTLRKKSATGDEGVQPSDKPKPDLDQEHDSAPNW